MAKLRYHMPLAELEATMRAEGGKLEKVESLMEPASARYYRFGDELLRVDGGWSFFPQGEDDKLVYIGWRVYDYYIYSPEAERRRLQESIERLEKVRWLFPDPNVPPKPSSERRSHVPQDADPNGTAFHSGG